ncbi:MAG: hypothetical protein EOO47_01030 [Flavobacterium sp.]|nr:MAG: hypothetical protein EOO47_01030 [Flavobacterium sp.]
MDILLYLIELLKTRKTIGIAGLGTFYKLKSPGKYDTAQHAFVPPTYKLSFTTDLVEQEELANYISQERNITAESANYYISEFAERIQNELAEKQEVDLANLGKLELSNGEINFTETAGNNIGFDFLLRTIPPIYQFLKNCIFFFTFLPFEFLLIFFTHLVPTLCFFQIIDVIRSE